MKDLQIFQIAQSSFILILPQVTKVHDMNKAKRKFSSFFKSLVIELDKDLYGPDNHLVEVRIHQLFFQNFSFLIMRRLIFNSELADFTTSRLLLYSFVEKFSWHNPQEEQQSS